jgi:hypothetical protein
MTTEPPLSRAVQDEELCAFTGDDVLYAWLSKLGSSVQASCT